MPETELTDTDRAAITANVAEWLERPLPDHIVIALKRIWNSNERNHDRR